MRARFICAMLLAATACTHEVAVTFVGLDEQFEAGEEVCREWRLFKHDSPVSALAHDTLVVGDGGDAPLDLRTDGLRLVVSFWGSDDACSDPCELEAGVMEEPAFCPPSALAVSDTFDIPRTGDIDIAVDVDSIDVLAPSSLWPPDGVRYARNEWPRPTDPGEATASFGKVRVALGKGALAKQLRFAFTPATTTGGTPTCVGEPTLPANSQSGIVRDDVVVPLFIANAEAVCLAVQSHNVWGRWQLVPTDFVVTLAGKAAGHEFPNPNQFVAFARMPETLPVDLASAGREPADVGVALADRGDDPLLYVEAGRGWMPALPESRPGALDDVAAVYDALGERVLVFGAWGTSATVWAWDGAAWSSFASDCAASPCPRPRTGFAAASGTSTLVFGGIDVELQQPLADLWQWDDGGWTELPSCATGACPEARTDHAMTWDTSGATPRLLLFGGADAHGELADTWAWDGDAWTQLATSCGASCPAARQGHAMSFDAARNQVVLFGGRNASAGDLGDTWLWSGSAWSQATTTCDESSPCPSARRWHAIAYDGGRELVTMFGGASDVAGNLDDAWTWDGTSWSDASFACGGEECPPPRARHGLAYDASHDAVVMFGGASDERVWDLRVEPDARPAHLLRVALWASGLDEAHIESVAIEIGAGASDVDTDAAGAELLVWSGEWQTLATNDADIDAPTPLTVQNSVVASWPTQLDERGATMTFAIRPAAAQGEHATVATDYAAAVISYVPPEAKWR